MLDLDMESVWATAAAALHADSEHFGDWRDGVCACDDDAAVVLEAAKFDALAAELRAARDEHAALGRSIQELKVSESAAKALCVKQEIELRAAREVIARARPYVVYTPPCDCPDDAHPLASALAAYDQAITAARP